jgi:hypothetical protein
MKMTHYRSAREATKVPINNDDPYEATENNSIVERFIP